MLEASEDIGLEVFYMAPSCVPATHLETAGAELSGNDIEKLAPHPRVLGLAEVMNFPGVIMGDEAILDKLERFWDKIIDGHSPGLSGAQLDAYLCGGIGSDHECTRLEEAWEKLGKGMHIMLREGSQARDLEALAPLVTAQTKQLCMLVSDDCYPEDLLEQGHMNRILKRAMALSIDPITAIQLASLNPARYFGARISGRYGVAQFLAAAENRSGVQKGKVGSRRWSMLAGQETSGGKGSTDFHEPRGVGRGRPAPAGSGL
jgi:adenine deaminase